MELIGVLAGPILNCVTCSFSQLQIRSNYIKNIGENFENLMEKARELNNRKEDINKEIARDTVLKMPSAECEAWLKKVQEIENQVNDIEMEFNKNKRCIGRWCSRSRFKLGKHIVATIQKITEVIEVSKFKGEVVVDAPPRIVEQTPTLVIQGKTLIDRTVQKILRCLTEENSQMIGVWGMGGVGKTTVMKALNNRQEISQMFQIVIWVTVSKDWSLGNLQKQIARRLKLDLLDHESKGEHAKKLYQKMKTMNYLLLLDDLWDKIELEDVGVPSPTRENGCKIVATTRSLLVCKKMCTDEEIKVEMLSDEEAWNLFCEKVCDVVDYPSIQPLAKDVVQECGGLPLAIIVIGGSLRKEKDVQVWSYALRELKNATFELHDMEELVFKQLKFSYDQLHDDNLKRCFLYCALYPEGFEINALELIENWWAEGLIDGVQNLGDAHDKGYAMVNDLINASLLERIEGHYHLSVKMHDVIRDLALRIGKFLVRAGVGMEEPPNEEEWREVEGISLMYNNLKKLPKRPECTSLSTLLLQCNRIKTIPKLFFVEMLNLRVLNLSWNGIRQLLMQVGHLKRLEMLHLQSGVSGILYLPSEVGLLTRLRSLRVTFALDSYTSNMVMIPNGVLTSLSLLEDLIINVCGVGNAMLCLHQIATATAEVANLKYLNRLEFPFARKGDLEHFLERSSAWKDKRLKSFEFLVGDDWVRPSSRRDDRGTRYLKLEARNDVPSIVSIEKVLIRCSAFTLQHHGTIKNILDISDMVNMQGLKFCLIAHCNAMETFVDVNSSSSSLPPPAILPNLEDLELVALPQLRTIWKGPLSLTSLRNLELSKCPKVTNVFSRGMTQQLSNLEGLTIDLCQGIEVIVNKEDDDGIVVNKDDEEIPVILFPRLKALHLLTIPKLVSICKGIQNPIGWPSLMKFHISGCPNLKRFPLSIHNAPVLTSIGGGQLEWWESLEWDDDDDITKQQLPYLFKGPDFW